MSLAANLRRIRQGQQLSQPDLAKAAEVSKGYIYMLEKGEMENPSIDVLFRIAKVLDCTIADLTGERKTVAKDVEPEFPESLTQFAKLKKKAGEPISPDFLRSLAHTQFRGRRPQTIDDWAYLYEFLKRTFGKRE